MSKLSPSDGALLQARSAYNNAQIQEVQYGNGYTIGSDDVIIKMNRMAWGLFEATILKAMKDRPDLCERNPELVANDKPCEECKGVGNFPFEGEEYEKQLADWNGDMKLGDYFYVVPGTPIAKFCSPCQGTGIKLKEQY